MSVWCSILYFMNHTFQVFQTISGYLSSHDVCSCCRSCEYQILAGRKNTSILRTYIASHGLRYPRRAHKYACAVSAALSNNDDFIKPLHDYTITQLPTLFSNTVKQTLGTVIHISQWPYHEILIIPSLLQRHATMSNVYHEPIRLTSVPQLLANISHHFSHTETIS